MLICALQNKTKAFYVSIYLLPWFPPYENITLFSKYNYYNYNIMLFSHKIPVQSESLYLNGMTLIGSDLTSSSVWRISQTESILGVFSHNTFHICWREVGFFL